MEIKIPEPELLKSRKTEKVVREPLPSQCGHIMGQLFNKGVMQETDIFNCTCAAGRFIGGI